MICVRIKKRQIVKQKIGQCTLVHCPYRLYKEENYASSGIVSSSFFVLHADNADGTEKFCKLHLAHRIGLCG